MNCRGCGSTLLLTFLDLGHSPIANNLVEIQTDPKKTSSTLCML
jgi:hypothetical protein